MSLLFLSSKNMRDLVDLDELRGEMAQALISTLKRETKFPPRFVSDLNQANVLGFMPAINEKLQIAGHKTVAVYPGNRLLALNPHQGVVILLDYESGQVKCILEGSTLTALRTAAVSAVATDTLARKDARVLVVIGAGKLAQESIKAVLRIRKFEKVIVYNRNAQTALSLIEEFKDSSDIIFEIGNSVIKAVGLADVAITCTSANEPLFKTSDLKEGAHINALGACRPGSREIEVVKQSNLKIFIDQFEAAQKEAEELSAFKVNMSLFTTEIGEALENGFGRVKEEITFFKTTGIAAFDLHAAEYFYQKAISRDIGQRINFYE